jgi:hypothetical protein
VVAVLLLYSNRIRWERRDDIHEAFLGLATCLITHRHVQRLC